MRYLSFEDLLRIHSAIISEIGGADGVRDRYALLAADGLPQQFIGEQELYPIIHEKAAVYLRSIIANHPFVDGNKRTGMAAAFIFLSDNGYVPTAPPGSIEDFAVFVATGKPDIASIAAWLEKNTQLES